MADCKLRENILVSHLQFACDTIFPLLDNAATSKNVLTLLQIFVIILL